MMSSSQSWPFMDGLKTRIVMICKGNLDDELDCKFELNYHMIV